MCCELELNAFVRWLMRISLMVYKRLCLNLSNRVVLMDVICQTVNLLHSDVGTAGDVCWKLAMVTCMLMLIWVTSGVDGRFLSDG